MVEGHLLLQKLSLPSSYSLADHYAVSTSPRSSQQLMVLCFRGLPVVYAEEC